MTLKAPLFILHSLAHIGSPSHFISHWTKPGGTGGSSRGRRLTGFAITAPVTGELVRCLAQLELSDPLPFSGWIPTNGPWGVSLKGGIKLNDTVS